MNKAQRWIVGPLALMVLGSVGFYGLDYYRKATQVVAVSPCIANLKQLQGAKDCWALEHGKSSNDVPTDTELFGAKGYIREKAKCPQGGVYTIGKAGDRPQCTIPEHNLDYGWVEVVDEQGNPIVGATVTVETKANETNVSGLASTNTGEFSPKWIVVSKAGYKTERLEFPVSWPAKVTLKRNQL